MIGALTRIFDNLLGRGEAAVTVPPLDGAFRPNRLLDEAPSRVALDQADGLAVVAGEIVVSAGDAVHTLAAGGTLELRRRFAAAVTAIAATGDGGLAAALQSGEIVIHGGAFDGRSYKAGEALRCITALVVAGGHLYVANGSATNSPSDWQRDLLERNASGSIWRIDLAGGASSRLASGLAWPAGLAVDAEGVVFSEAWKHHLARIDAVRPGRPKVLQHDLPGYPGRISPAVDGYWLALFAPRSQLVEFVLREDDYRASMLAEIEPEYWVAPSLSAAHSFLEPMQLGGLKQLGILKPWAPTRSYGLVIGLDRSCEPLTSFHSRADGRRHGITSALEAGGRLILTSKGGNAIVSVPLGRPGARA